jgi:hypothetical protein
LLQQHQLCCYQLRAGPSHAQQLLLLSLTAEMTAGVAQAAAVGAGRPVHQWLLHQWLLHPAELLQQAWPAWQALLQGRQGIEG